MRNSTKPVLFVTIPAYNEEATIGQVISSIPRKIAGVSSVKVLVWDDGSEDGTAQAAKKAGADFIFANKRNLGLAQTFDLATKKAVNLGAEIVVNTDADNQYNQQEIPQLISPILSGEYDVINGDRQVEHLTHMPAAKKYGNLMGSFVIRKLTNADIRDASSGFRAYTAHAIQSLAIFSNHTYTHETLIQLTFSPLRVGEIPVSFHARAQNNGGSRLIKSVPSHIVKSAVTIIRSVLMYKPLPFLLTLGSIELLIAFLITLRFLILFLFVDGDGHVQSLILASMIFMLGLITIMIAFLADLVSINRQLLLANRKHE